MSQNGQNLRSEEGQSMDSELLLPSEHVTRNQSSTSGLGSDMFLGRFYTLHFSPPHCLLSRALHSNLRRVYFVLTICLHTFESKILIPCVRCHRAPLPSRGEENGIERRSREKIAFSIQKLPSPLMRSGARENI